MWLIGYLLAVLLMSGIGTFGGAGVISAPWDSVMVAVIGLVAFEIGVRAAVAHLRLHPAPEPPPEPGTAEPDRSAAAHPGPRGRRSG
jgi:hypothetical protein